MFASIKKNLLAGLAAMILIPSVTASANTVAHYRFEDGSAGNTATQAVDSSANGNDLNAVGEPVYSSEVPVSPVPATEEPNELSIDVAGGENAFEGPDDEGLNAVVFDDITVEAWINFSAGGGWQTFIGRDDATNQTGTDEPMLQFQNTDAGNFRLAWYDRSEQYLDMEAFAIQDNTWYHVAAVGDINAGTMTLYVDGNQVASNDGYTGMFAPSPAGTWSIGRGQWGGGNSDWVNAQIDEVRFSDAALTVGQFLNFDEAEVNIVQSPADRAAWTGQDVTFNVQATLIGDGDLEYQWQISEDGGETWQDIDGATSPSYTIASAGLDLDRNRYRVLVSFEDITEISDSALLRVGDGPAPAQEGVIAHYRFEEGSDGATATGAVDSSGNGYDLGVVGEPVYSSDVPASQVPQTGENNDLSVDFSPGEVAFQGVDGEGLSTVPVDDFTIEAFINFSDGGGWQTFIGRDDREDQTNDPHAIFYMQNRGDGNQFGVSWVDRNGNLEAPGLLGPVAQNNTWYHVAAVADLEAETISLYVNGVEVDRYEGFPGLFVPESPPSTNWSIGRGQWTGGNSDWVNARIDEVRFSDRPLTPTEFLGFSTAALNFLTQPEDVTAFVGDEVSFSALAGGGGTGELTYQWEVSEDGGETWSDISGATGSTYTIESADFGLDGNLYRNVASRDGDTLASNTASLSVPDYPDPVIVEDFEPAPLVLVGDTFVYSVEATGLGNITYQWLKDGEELEGETGNTLEFDPVALDDGGTYSVIVSDDAATQDDMEPRTVTLTSILAVAPRLKGAISLNFVGAGSGEFGSSAQIGVLEPDELTGAFRVANWNNSAEVGGVANQSTPIELEDDMGEDTTATATWSAANTWSANAAVGWFAGNPDQRLFHGYIESRAGSGDTGAATTVTIEGIPYDSYDVYVYPMGVEGASGTFARSVTLDDGEEVRQKFMMNYFGGPTPEEVQYILSHSTTLDDAEETPAATYFRFEGVSGSSIVLQHFDEIDWNSGGFAGISIVDTTPTTPARPEFVERPADQFLPGGGDASFSVAAQSHNEGGSLSYQWEKDGNPLAGETGATLTIENASSEDAGQYTVVVTDDSNMGSSINRATASLLVVDENRPALLSADMNVGGHAQMSGHGMLRADGLQDFVYPASAADNPMEIGEGDTFWNALAGAGGTTTYDGLVDSQGLGLPGVTFTVTGAGAAEDAPGGGGLEDLEADQTYSASLFRDYVFTEGDDEMTLTVGGLHAFAGLEVTLVVYAVGKDSAAWPDAENQNVDQNDVATVTLAEANNEFNEAPVETEQEVGREMRWNELSFAAFDARVAGNGTVSWTIGPVAGEPGLNAFNGFQLRITNQGEAIEPEGIADWRQDFFGTPANEGDAANGADPDGDGFVNLMEYALGTDPTVAGEAHSAVVQGRDGDFLTLSFNHIADPDLTYAVEATDDLAGEWVEVANFGSFASEGTQTYTDDQAVGDNPSRFLRLKVTIAE